MVSIMNCIELCASNNVNKKKTLILLYFWRKFAHCLVECRSDNNHTGRENIKLCASVCFMCIYPEITVILDKKQVKNLLFDSYHCCCHRIITALHLKCKLQALENVTWEQPIIIMSLLSKDVFFLTTNCKYLFYLYLLKMFSALPAWVYCMNYCACFDYFSLSYLVCHSCSLTVICTGLFDVEAVISLT